MWWLTCKEDQGNIMGSEAEGEGNNRRGSTRGASKKMIMFS